MATSNTQPKPAAATGKASAPAPETKAAPDPAYPDRTPDPAHSTDHTERESRQAEVIFETRKGLSAYFIGTAAAIALALAVVLFLF